MIVEILTLEEVLFSKEAVSVIVPGANGTFEMLDNHAPIISTLQTGTVKITDTNNQQTSIELIGGSIEMSNNKVTILADTE
jgi:F-type H+-transporting ATPase subunit epsilon